MHILYGVYCIILLVPGTVDRNIVVFCIVRRYKYYGTGRALHPAGIASANSWIPENANVFLSLSTLD